MKNVVSGKSTAPRFGLKRQAALAGIVLAIGLAAATALAYGFQWTLYCAARHTAEVDVPETTLAHQIALQAARCFAAQAEFEAVADAPEPRRETLESWHQAYRGLEQLLGAAPAGTSDEACSRLAAWQKLGGNYQRSFLAAVDRARAGQTTTADARRESLADSRATILAILAQAEQWALQRAAECQAGGHELQQLADSQIRLVMLRAVVVLLILAAAGLWLSRNVLKRIAILSAAVSRFTSGNYATRIACTTNDELGTLGYQFNEMACLIRRNQEQRQQPRSVAPPADQLSQSVPAREQEILSGEPKTKLDCRVLVAEDGPENQRLIAFLLKRAGAEVQVVSNGRDVLRKVLPHTDEPPGHEPAQPFDAILMDLDMPVMDGWEATRRLRQSGYTGLVIAVTGHGDRYSRDKCLKTGFDDYIAKPLDRHTLLQILETHAILVAEPAGLAG